MAEKPITIKPGMIIPRPKDLAVITTLPETAPGGGSLDLKSIKGHLGDIKELVDMAKELGFDVDLKSIAGKFGLGKEKKAAADPAPERKQIAAPPITKKQVIGFLNLVKIQYGDLPISEIAAHLEKDLPDKGDLL